MNRFILSAVQRVLQQLTARARLESPRAAQLLAALANRSLALDISGTGLKLLFHCDGEGLRLAEPDSHADAGIAGAPLSLLALSGEQAAAVIRRGDVRIEGDAEVAQQFRELALLLRPDLEHALSQGIGRSGAHLTFRGLRAAFDWGRAAGWTSLQNVAEFLAHERRVLVPRAEAEHYLQNTERSREQLDRLEARLQLLEKRVLRLSGGPVPP